MRGSGRQDFSPRQKKALAGPLRREPGNPLRATLKSARRKSAMNTRRTPAER